jgi:rhodanese-related sulfurtransferase
MKKLNKLFFISLLSLLIFNFFIKNKAEADARQSYDQFLAGKAVFIDVREEAEVNEGMIKGAVWIPLSLIEKDKTTEIEKIKTISKDKEIYVYCRSGNRSGKVKSYLEEAGLKAVNMGGYNSLVSEKIPTQPGPK